MPCRHHEITVRTTEHHQVLDLTGQVRAAVDRAGARDGVVTVFTPHATAAIAINENADPNIGVDLQNAMGKMVVEHDGWLHDRIDDNAAAHIKAAIVGPSESIPLVEGKLALGTWQDVFLCEFDGPRSTRRVIVTVVW
jgi:secondary thiamine-phosphate synthase enzyme